MTNPPRRSVASAALAMTGCLLLAGCSNSAPAAQADAPAVQTTAGATPTTPASQATTSAGSTTTPGASGGNVKACSLLTEQELTPLLGSDPGPGTDTSGGTTSSCAYTGAGVVTIVVDHSDGKSHFDMFCTTKQPQPGVQNVNDIAVADGACLTIVGGPVAAMYILKGPDLMSINIQAGLDTKITPEALIALGKIAAGRV
jgi:hypothetical protein